jgi:hypothetical protein
VLRARGVTRDSGKGAARDPSRAIIGTKIFSQSRIGFCRQILT